MTDNPTIGRPSSYTPEIAARICDRLIEGLSVREVCKADDMPAPSTVFLWLTKHPEFSEQYARALEARTDAMADDLLVIADDGTNDWVKNQDGGESYNGDHVQRSKLRVDARKWLMSKMAPKKYGDRQAIDHSGSVDLGLAELFKAIDGQSRGLPKIG